MAYRVYDAYGTAMDVKETWETWHDPCAGLQKKLVSTATTILGMIPGGKQAKKAANAIEEAGDAAKRADDVAPRVVYRGGSSTPDNLTPRPGIDDTGLSTFDNLEAATQPGGKAQIIDLDRLTTLQADPDNDPPGHVSIAPNDPTKIKDWAATRGSGKVHPNTQEILNAIVGEAKRPK